MLQTDFAGGGGEGGILRGVGGRYLVSLAYCHF